MLPHQEPLVCLELRKLMVTSIESITSGSRSSLLTTSVPWPPLQLSDCSSKWEMDPLTGKASDGTMMELEIPPLDSRVSTHSSKVPSPTPTRVIHLEMRETTRLSKGTMTVTTTRLPLSGKPREMSRPTLMRLWSELRETESLTPSTGTQVTTDRPLRLHLRVATRALLHSQPLPLPPWDFLPSELKEWKYANLHKIKQMRVLSIGQINDY